MLRVAIIHFQPLEQYPPVQNFIRFLEKDSSDSEIYVYTTYTSVNGIPNFKIGNNKIKILRIGKTGQKMAVLKRYWNYSKFYAGCLFHLIKKKTGQNFILRNIVIASCAAVQKNLPPSNRIADTLS